MKRQELRDRIYQFVKELPVNDTEEIRLTFLEVIARIKDERFGRAPGESPADTTPVEAPPEQSVTTTTGEPALDGNIKDLFFNQLKQVANQLTSAGKQAISQMGGIKKDFTEKVKLTDNQKKPEPPAEKDKPNPPPQK